MSSSQVRGLSIVIGLLIMAHGIFSEQIVPYYQSITEYIIWDDTLKIELIGLLNGPHYSRADRYNLGEYFLAKPIYFGLHMLLISVLYWNNPKSRCNALLIFIGILLVLLSLILLTYFLEIKSVYAITKGMLTNALNLPIILFFVEGGKILNNDINKLLGLNN